MIDKYRLTFMALRDLGIALCCFVYLALQLLSWVRVRLQQFHLRRGKRK